MKLSEILGGGCLGHICSSLWPSFTSSSGAFGTSFWRRYESLGVVGNHDD